MTDDLDRLDNMMAVGGRLDVRGSGPAAWGRYNEFAEGGNIYSGKEPHSQQMNQGYIYDVPPQLYAMDEVNVRVSSGFRPNAVALGGNLYDEGGPKTRMTADGRTLHYSIVPSTREVRWIDFDDSKDFDGLTGYRFYDNALNKKHYTQWQETAPEATVQPAPTKSEANNLVRARGYKPDITRPMWRLSRMPHEQGLQGVYPEFALLTLSSPKLRRMYKQKMDEYLQELSSVA